MMHYNERQKQKSKPESLILKENIFDRLQKLLCKLTLTLCFMGTLSVMLSVEAADERVKANKNQSSGKQTTASSGKKTDAYTGWELYQTSKSMGTNRLMLCSAGMKIVNPLMSVAYWPKSDQLVMINNSNHKYFICSKEKFPHYVKMVGFDIFATESKDFKYSDWKKIDIEPVAAMHCVLYQRQALNLPQGAERREQTWATSEISLPETAHRVFSDLIGRPDACRFGFPMKSKAITNNPIDGFKVRVDFDTREVSKKQFTARDFLVPKAYMRVKEFSEFLLNDSESKLAPDHGNGSADAISK